MASIFDQIDEASPKPAASNDLFSQIDEAAPKAQPSIHALIDAADAYQPPEIKAYNPSLARRALTSIREGLSPLIGQTKTQQLQAEADRQALERDIPALSALLENAPKGNKTIDEKGILPALTEAMFTPPEWAPQLPTVDYDISIAPDSQDMKIPFVSKKISDTIAQIAAGTYNTGAGMANSMVSPGGVALLGGGAPAKVALGALTGQMGKAAVENAIPTVQTLGNPNASVQEKTEAALGEGLSALGAIGGTMGLKKSLAPKVPDISTQIDSASSKTNPRAANAAANDIAMQKPDLTPVEPNPPANTGDVAIEAINKNIRDNAPPVPETPVKASDVADMSPEEFNKFQIDKNITEEAKRVGENATTPEDIAYLADQGKLARSEAKRLVAEKDFETLAKVMTREQFFNEAHQAATKSEPFATDVMSGAREADVSAPTKTKAELIKEIMAKNPDADVEAPKQLLKKGSYEVRDVPVSEIGDVFGAKTIQPKVVERYVKNPSSDPIILADVNGEFRPVDGKHRLTAAIERGDETIRAYVPVESEIGKPSAPVEPQTLAQPFVIPQDLAKSNPRYSYGQNKFEVRFDSDLDKALYILAGEKKSAADARFLKLVQDSTGMTEAEARTAGKAVRQELKMMAKEGSDGDTLTVPTIHEVNEPQIAQAKPTPKSNAVQIKSPESVPVHAQPEASQAVVQEVRRRIEEPSAARQEAQQVGDSGAGGVVPPDQIPAPSPDLNNPLPNRGWTPFISKTRIGKQLKVLVGTIEGNIRKPAPEVFGALRERGYKLNELKKGWHDSSKDFGEVARKTLKPEAFTELDRLLQSGLHDEALDFIKRANNEPELRSSIEKFKSTLDALRSAEIEAGREVGDIKNYWIREVADYEGLRRELGKDPSHAAEKAIRAAEKAKDRPLTPDEEAAVINNLISTSFSGQGKPGFLNPRTIGEIQKNWFKYYEPSDVAMENRINRVAKDVVNRAYFGKFDPTGESAPMAGKMGVIEGHFGAIINRMLDNGTLSPEGSKIVIRNLQDFFGNETRYDDVSSGLANKIRKAQTFGYLGDIANAIPQYGDFFLGAWRNGFLDAGKGFFTKRKFSLADIGVHEGNPDTAVFSKKNKEGLVGGVYRNAVNLFLGTSDRFNKGGLLNTSFHEAARDIRDTSSQTYQNLNRKWSERFPDRWPAILRDLQSKDFANGKLNPNTRFFLYSELADLQPISGEATAQAFNRMGPWGKILYGLRSFAIKQIDVMRQEGYEKMRDPTTRREGVKNLVTYALIVGVGQQFIGSYLRDKLLDRESDTSEYAVSGLLQLMGLNRYALYRAKEQGLGTAGLEMMVPGVGILNDLTQSLGVTRDWLTNRRSTKTGLKTVPTFADVIKQSEATKYLPGVGREIYSYYGLGREKELKRRAQAAAGKSQPTTLQQINEMIVPSDKKN